MVCVGGCVCLPLSARGVSIWLKYGQQKIVDIKQDNGLSLSHTHCILSLSFFNTVSFSHDSLWGSLSRHIIIMFGVCCGHWTHYEHSMHLCVCVSESEMTRKEARNAFISWSRTGHLNSRVTHTFHNFVYFSIRFTVVTFLNSMVHDE